LAVIQKNMANGWPHFPEGDSWLTSLAIRLGP